MGLIVALSNSGNKGIQQLWQTVRARFWDFMDRIAKAQRKTPACRG